MFKKKPIMQQYDPKYIKVCHDKKWKSYRHIMSFYITVGTVFLFWNLIEAMFS
ncbi:conserved hypothetical protein [Candidatus Liberibacter solanacearum]